MGEWASPSQQAIRADGGTLAVTSDSDPGGLRYAQAQWPTITVPETPAGVATAVSYSSVAHATLGPERSHPTRRGRPPRITFGPREVPATLQQARHDTDITFVLPAAYEPLFVAAPLAYYLGARIELDAGGAPRLTAPAADVDVTFERDQSFADDVARLLQRCFFLDTLVRDIPGDHLANREELCTALDLDPAQLRCTSPAERLGAYLTVDGVETHRPDWHLTTYLDPIPLQARSLPHLLEVLSLIYPAEATELDGRERLRRSLDDFYRAGANVAAVDVVSPSLRAGKLHGWLAQGTPIDAYKASHTGFEHGHRHRNRLGQDRTGAVVVNDEAMGTERTVAAIYQDDAPDQSLDVSVYENLRTDDLAAVFRKPHALVHFVGHCEVDGLECPDGMLDVAELSDVKTHTFFLNACGSYHQGRALVEAGSTAGAVTLAAVLDDQAATVGTTFARLVAAGFPAAHAVDLARSRILMGKDYAVVGDGTARAVEPDRPPAVLSVADGEDGQYHVTYESVDPRNPGGSHADPFETGARLTGDAIRKTMDAPQLLAFVDGRTLPVLYGEQFLWAEDLSVYL